MAIDSGELSLIEYFLLHNADPTNQHHYDYRYCANNVSFSHSITTAVYNAIMLDRLDLLILFAQYGTDYNKICYEVKSYAQNESLTPLQLAIRNSKKEIVSFLLFIGVDI